MSCESLPKRYENANRSAELHERLSASPSSLIRHIRAAFRSRRGWIKGDGTFPSLSEADGTGSPTMRGLACRLLAQLLEALGDWPLMLFSPSSRVAWRAIRMCVASPPLGQDLTEKFAVYAPPANAGVPLPASEEPRALGTLKPRGEVHRDGDWHRSVHVWLIDAAGRLLLQRRGSGLRGH